MRQILRKRIYTGAFDFDGVTYQGSQEPLITTDLWDRVQRILDERKEHQTKVFVESFLSQDSSVAAAVGCA